MAGHGVTGLPGLDALVGPVPWWWIVEFYGDRRVTGLVAHHAAAEASRRGTVVVVVVQDFGGFDPYLARRLAKRKRGSPDSILVTRAFRLTDVPDAVEEALFHAPEAIVIVDPYLYAPRSPHGYQALTPVTSAIRRASQHARVVVANRATRYGRGVSPEGGGFHHHTVHVLVRLRESRRGVQATLVKHPGRPVPRHALVPYTELEVYSSWAGPRPLLEYL